VVVAILFLLAGAAILTVGAEGAIRGAGSLARRRGLSPFVLGALLFGIDLESLGAALVASARGQTAIAAGEAFGTIVFLLSLAFGLALLLAPGPVPAPSASMVLLPAVPLLGAAMAISIDRTVSRWEGAALVSLYVAYLGLVLWEGRAAQARGEEIAREAEEGPRIPALPLLVMGLVMVYTGAVVVVEGGARLLDHSGLTAGFVGAALLGSLAGLDEVALEVLPIRRGLPELATGNLFGTVAAFSSGVLGLAALVRPLHVDAAGVTAYLVGAMLYCLIAAVFLKRGRAGKVLGAAVLIAYAGWLVYAARL
jgi:cation:H+ antiporter